MKLKEVLKNINYSNDIEDVDITNIEVNSKLVVSNSLFFCIVGVNSDGHTFASDAINNGAEYVVVERDLGLKKQIIVKDTKKAYALACCNFFHNPSKKIKIIGITGTNGKTSSTYILKHILESCGHKTGLIGTIKNEIGDIDIRAKYTTPQSFELNALLNKMVQSNCEYAVMEVSSHALAQHRTYGIEFFTGAFTNLTQDHLDYHKTMDGYFNAKKILLEKSIYKVINLDDKYCIKLLEEFKDNTITYSINDNSADVLAKNIKMTISSIQFELLCENIIKRVNFNMPGKFSTYNALCAISCALTLGISVEDIVKSLSSCKGVKGRAEVLYSGDFTIICDYAHTSDGLQKFLESIKPYVTGRLIALFGCAGERDWTKREKMGETVGGLADFVVLTSDNPRKEDSLEIIKHAEKGLNNTKVKYKSIADRYGAILWATDNLKSNDVLCLLGKGHEDYQVLYSSTVYFDEHKIIEDILKDKGLI